MSAPASPTFFISGINHCELRPGQQLSIDHLRSLQQQLAEHAGRARAIQQQLQQQAAQQGLRAAAPAGVTVKAEPGAAAAAALTASKTEEDGPQQAQQTQQQLQYAALLALQLQQQRAAAAAAQAQQAQGPHARPAGASGPAAAAFAGGPTALAQNLLTQQGGRQGVNAGGPAGLPLHSSAADVAGRGGGRGRGAQAGGWQRQGAAAKQSKDEPEDSATDQWVQCSKCQQWRQVPDEFWPDIENADEDEDWMCKDALWDVEDYEPNTPACC